MLPDLPLGRLEYPEPGTVVQGSVPFRLVGWAASPRVIGRIEISIDGKVVAKAAHNDRPDVVKAYPSLQSIGYEATVALQAYSNGPHRIGVTVFTASGSSRVVAQVPIEITGN
jgi:hypothetical protein